MTTLGWVAVGFGGWVALSMISFGLWLLYIGRHRRKAIRRQEARMGMLLGRTRLP